MSAKDPNAYIENVRAAIDAIAAGKMVIMVDDEDRENEGDLVFAAEHSRPELVNFMAKEARGLICLTLEKKQVEKLGLVQMKEASKNHSPEERSTAFTVSIEAKEGVTTGISAADRHQTIKVACDVNTTANDIVVPGHIFPLKAQEGGVLERAGHTEGSVDLARLAGCRPAGVICEIMNDDGTMARMPDLIEFSKKHDIPIVSIADLIAYRLQHDHLVEKVGSHTCELNGKTVFVNMYKSIVDGSTHLSLSNRECFSNEESVHVRVHSQQALLDTFDFLTPFDTKLQYGLKLIGGSEPATLVYLTRKTGEVHWDKQFKDLITPSEDTTKPLLSPIMDQRTIGTGAQMLRDLGVKKMIAHMTRPTNMIGLPGFGLEIQSVEVIKLGSK